MLRARPKSVRTTRPSQRTRMFDGFTSRCTMPLRCAAESASAICAAKSTTEVTYGRPQIRRSARARASASSPPGARRRARCCRTRTAAARVAPSRRSAPRRRTSSSTASRGAASRKSIANQCAPSPLPTPCTATIPGCSSLAASADSRRKRATAVASSVRWAGRTFSATVRSRLSCVASYTTPIPPRPISRTRRWSPRIRASGSGSGCCARGSSMGTSRSARSGCAFTRSALGAPGAWSRHWR